jgi:hypothetical protein
MALTSPPFAAAVQNDVSSRTMCGAATLFTMPRKPQTASHPLYSLDHPAAAQQTLNRYHYNATTAAAKSPHQGCCCQHPHPSRSHLSATCIIFSAILLLQLQHHHAMAATANTSNSQ